jgi:hypothetical protein
MSTIPVDDEHLLQRVKEPRHVGQPGCREHQQDRQDGRRGQEDKPGGLERPGAETVQTVLASVDKHGEGEESHQQHADQRSDGGNPLTPFQGYDHRRDAGPDKQNAEYIFPGQR